jgi:putative ABC transport system permease protein
MTPRSLERVARMLIRCHGREFAATYEEAILLTIEARAQRERRRGRMALIAFVLRETAALARAAIAQRLRPDCTPDATSGAIRIEQVTRELHRAGRRLARTPLFTAAVVITLTLAISANATVFALMSRIVFAPLPYPSAARLIALDHSAPGIGLASNIGISIGLYRGYDTLPSIEALSLYTTRDGTLSGHGEARRVRFLQATPSLADVTGLSTRMGRWFTAAESEPGTPHVAVLTDAMWRQQFGGSAEAIGRMFHVDGVPHEIVGVLDAATPFHDPRVQFVTPLPNTWTRATGFNYAGIARLRAGVTLDRARRDQDAIIAGLSARYPADTEIGTFISGGLRSIAIPLTESVVGGAATTLWILLGAVAIVLAMACANLANLFLLRQESKRHDLAVERALGARSFDLTLQLVSETLLVAVAAGALGLALASVAIAFIAGVGTDHLPRLHEVRLDASTVGFTVGLVGGIALILALIPLSRLWRRQPGPVAAAERRGTPSSAQMMARKAFMATQVGLAVVLLSSAGLMIRSVSNLLQVDPGFDDDSRLVFEVSAPRHAYRTRAAAAAFQTALLDRLQALPGIESAAVTSTLPLDGVGMGDPLDVRGRLVDSAAALPIARFRRVSGGYFSTMGIALRAGRLFDHTDAAGLTDAVVVNAALARTYFGDNNPLGQQVRPIENARDARWLTIVGVVGDTATDTLSEATRVPIMYMPLTGAMWADVPAPHDVAYVLKTSRDPLTYVDSVRATVATLDPSIAIGRSRLLSSVVARARSNEELTMLILIVAAAIAAVVGAVGVYAVMAYAVSQRHIEIGVRVAVGATPRQVTALVVGQGARVIAGGLGLGLMAAVAGAQFLRSLLFGVQPGDLSTHAAVAIGVASVAILACWWPARRASRLDPTRTLRSG